MRAFKTKKIIAIFSLIIILGGFFPRNDIEAQFADPNTALILALVKQIQAGVGPSTIIPGPLGSLLSQFGVDISPNLLSLPAELAFSASQGCKTQILAVDALQQVTARTSFLSTLKNSLIGEDTTEPAILEGYLQVYASAQLCVTTILTILTSVPPPKDLNGKATFDSKKQYFTKLSVSYNESINSIKDKLDNSVKDFLKAILIRSLQNINKDLTTRVVNGLVEKFKISNYLQYADALGGQIYAMDYINKNFDGDARQQMMIRQLAQDQLLGRVEGVSVAKAFAQQKAEEYLGPYANGIDFTDPDFYFALAKAGSPEANPEYQYGQAEEQSRQAIATGLANANLEIANGKGFLPPRDCSGSVAEQQAIDEKQVQAGRRYTSALQVKGKLLNSKPRPAQAEIDKAQTELEAAQEALRALPKEVSKPVVEICKAIENPGGAVADQISGFLNSHLDEAANFDSANLPFFVTFLSDVASNFVSNVITGGKSTGQLFKEAGLGALQSTVGLAINTAVNQPTEPTFPAGTDDGSTTDTGSGDTGGSTGGSGGSSGGGQSTPATCEQVKVANDFGVRLSCQSLPTGPGAKFTFVIDYQSFLNEANVTNISIKLLTVRNNQQTVLVNDVPIDGSVTDTPGTIRYEVDNGISEDTNIVVQLRGTAKSNPSAQASRDAWLKVTLPRSGQVQGFSTQKLSLRSFEGPGLITGRPGITLR